MQIKEIVKLAPRKRQTLLFSATMTEQVQQLITMSLKQPVRLAADAAGRAPDELRQEIVRLKVCPDSSCVCLLGTRDRYTGLRDLLTPLKIAYLCLLSTQCDTKIILW